MAEITTCVGVIDRLLWVVLGGLLVMIPVAVAGVMAYVRASGERTRRV